LLLAMNPGSLLLSHIPVAAQLTRGVAMTSRREFLKSTGAGGGRLPDVKTRQKMLELIQALAWLPGS